MKISHANDIFERVEEDALKQAEEAMTKGMTDAAETIGVMTLIRAGVMTQLNLMGRLIWEELREPKTAEELATAICAKYDAPFDDVYEDIKAFVAELTAQGFLTNV